MIAIGAIGLGAWALTGGFSGRPAVAPPAATGHGHDGDGHGKLTFLGKEIPADHHGPFVGMDSRGYSIDPLDPDCRGCSPHKHPTPLLTEAEFAKLKAGYAAAPVNEPSESLDALLFYGVQSAFRLKTLGIAPLDSERAEFVQRELTRHGVFIELRVVDEFGDQRVTMPPTFWPFDIKQHYFPKPHELDRMQVPDINGTCKRVGLNHIWVRC